MQILYIFCDFSCEAVLNNKQFESILPTCVYTHLLLLLLILRSGVKLQNFEEKFHPLTSGCHIIMVIKVVMETKVSQVVDISSRKGCVKYYSIHQVETFIEVLFGQKCVNWAVSGKYCSCICNYADLYLKYTRPGLETDRTRARAREGTRARTRERTGARAGVRTMHHLFVN